MERVIRGGNKTNTTSEAAGVNVILSTISGINNLIASKQSLNEVQCAYTPLETFDEEQIFHKLGELADKLDFDMDDRGALEE